MIKLYVQTKEDEAIAETLLDFIEVALDDETEIGSALAPVLKENLINGPLQLFSNQCIVSQESALDAETLQEIGKTYKEQYDLAKAQNNQKAMDRMYGAMYAIKNIMEASKPQSLT